MAAIVCLLLAAGPGCMDGMTPIDGQALGWKDVGIVPWQDPVALEVFDGKLYASVYYSGDDGPRLAEHNGNAWSPTPGAPTEDVQVLGVIADTLYVGGTFTHLVGDVASEGLALYSSAGSETAFSPGATGVDLPGVWAVTEYNGQPIIGGQFPAFGGQLVNHIFAFNGSLVEDLDGGINGDPAQTRVDCLFPLDGKLYVGGTFQAVGTSATLAKNIAAWDGASWSALGGGADAAVRALIGYDGHLLVGGNFRTIDGAPANGLAVWDGASWSDFPGGGVFEDLDGTSAGVVACFAIYESELIVAGSFVRAGDVPASNIARWDGEAWHAMGAGVEQTGTNALVRDMVVFNGDLYLVGFFDRAGGAAVPEFARWGPVP